MTDFLDSIGDDEGDVGFDSTDSMAGDSISLSEAKEKHSPWRMMVWGQPGMGKTHFAYTMPKPICYIDTEGKAELIAHKFDMADEDFRLWQPKTFEEAENALEQAFSYLDYYKETEGKIGTIVVDSMSIMWELAQQHHIDEFYGGNKPIDGLKTAIGNQGMGDWVHIKRYHNQDFRQRMLDSPYNLLWTAMEDEDYQRKMEDGLSKVPMKPSGEKTNVYKITDVVRMEKDGKGRPVAMCQKSGLTKYKYGGLTFATFDKHKDLTAKIEELELAGEVPSKVEYEGRYVTLSEGNPIFEEPDA